MAGAEPCSCGGSAAGASPRQPAVAMILAERPRSRHVKLARNLLFSGLPLQRVAHRPARSASASHRAPAAVQHRPAPMRQQVVHFVVTASSAGRIGPREPARRLLDSRGCAFVPLIRDPLKGRGRQRGPCFSFPGCGSKGCSRSRSGWPLRPSGHVGLQDRAPPDSMLAAILSAGAGQARTLGENHDRQNRVLFHRLPNTLKLSGQSSRYRVPANVASTTRAEFRFMNLPRLPDCDIHEFPCSKGRSGRRVDRRGSTCITIPPTVPSSTIDGNRHQTSRQPRNGLTHHPRGPMLRRGRHAAGLPDPTIARRSERKSRDLEGDAAQLHAGGF